MIQMTEEDVQRDFRDLVQQVARSGESIHIRRADGAGVALVRTEERNPDAVPPERRKPFWQFAIELGESLPPSEVEKLPTDLAMNIDHYLYGHPKIVE